MTYEELLISIDLNGYENVLPSIGRNCLDSLDNMHWFIVCDDGDCHLFDRYGNENNISKIKEIYGYMIPSDIKKIVIPNNVTSINYGAFMSCCELTGVTIPDSVTNIGYRVFFNCISLESLIFKGKSLKQIKSMRNYPFGIEDESIIKCN